jgi:hypothetical protein
MVGVDDETASQTIDKNHRREQNPKQIWHDLPNKINAVHVWVFLHIFGRLLHILIGNRTKGPSLLLLDSFPKGKTGAASMAISQLPAEYFSLLAI